MAHNVTHRIKGDKLIIEVGVGAIDREEATPSSTGKMMIVGTTSGFATVETPDGTISLSLTAGYMAPKKGQRQKPRRDEDVL